MDDKNLLIFDLEKDRVEKIDLGFVPQTFSVFKPLKETQIHFLVQDEVNMYYYVFTKQDLKITAVSSEDSLKIPSIVFVFGIIVIYNLFFKKRADRPTSSKGFGDALKNRTPGAASLR